MYSLHTSPAPIAANTLLTPSPRRVNRTHGAVEYSIPEAICGGASDDQRDERHTKAFRLVHPHACDSVTRASYGPNTSRASRFLSRIHLAVPARGRTRDARGLADWP